MQRNFPPGPVSAPLYLVRGGSFDNAPKDIRTSNRKQVMRNDTPQMTYYGFWCAYTPRD